MFAVIQQVIIKKKVNMYPIIDIIKMMHSVRRRKILDIMIQFYNQYNFATVKASKYMYFKYETEVHEFLFFLTQK